MPPVQAPPAQAIVDYYRPKTSYEREAYIFSILTKQVHIPPLPIANRRLKKVLKQVNSGLKALASLASITVHLTMYVARHTYATVLKRSGVAIPVISDAIGHATPSITQIYLNSFADEVLDAANEHLLEAILHKHIG